MDKKIILETERLFLREMGPDDLEPLYRVLGDPSIMQHYPYSFDEKRVSDWIERNMNRYRENGFGLWAVCLKDTGELIGDCGLTPTLYAVTTVCFRYVCTFLYALTYHLVRHI